MTEVNFACENQSEEMKYYILFGPPGAGKGTQAGAIAARYNLMHVSTGELLRGEIAKKTELGLRLWQNRARFRWLLMLGSLHVIIVLHRLAI